MRKSLFDFSSQKKLIDISNSELSKDETNIKIGEMILHEKPFLVGRFGWTELDTLIRFERYSKMNYIENIFEWSRLNIYPFSKKCLLHEIHTKAGFYPVNKVTLKRFQEIMINTIPEVDILGSWLNGENNYIQFMENVEFCKLEFLEPYFWQVPGDLEKRRSIYLWVH